MSEIKTVGVVGFGVMGSAIGLNASASGYNVVFKEISDELVDKMYQKGVRNPLDKKIAKGRISQHDADSIASRIIGTKKNKDLSQCDLIIEAAIEKLDSKIQLFNELDKICSNNTIIVSNTSTFMIEQLMSSISNPSRTAGLHYFFPANINRLVEIIRQKQTSEETFNTLFKFAKKNSKVAIAVRDFPGFAVNPVFISSYMVLNSFYGNQYNVATLDAVSRNTLGVRFGIMWVQNGSGLSTCYHAAASMSDYLVDTDVGYPPVPKQLEEQSKSGIPWDLKDGEINENEKIIGTVRERLLGSIFTISTHLIEKGVVSKNDLEIGITTALAWPEGPFSMMNKLGMKETSRLVNLAVESGYFKMPKTFKGSIPHQWQV